MYPKSMSSTVVSEGEKSFKWGRKILTARTTTNGAVYRTGIERETDRKRELLCSKAEKLSLHLDIHSMSLSREAIKANKLK